MKTAIYPGSFNPIHSGHIDIIKKALDVFDKVVVAKGINPEKKIFGGQKELFDGEVFAALKEKYRDRVSTYVFEGLLVDAVTDLCVDAVVRGLRGQDDLEYEKMQQYYNEDLGLDIPVVYFISDRACAHVTSTGMRMIEHFKSRRKDG